MKERLAFDVGRYDNIDGLAEDLASLAIEASIKPLKERVNPVRLELVEDGRVIDRVLGQEDVGGYYSTETKLDRKEREAGLKIRDCLINDSVGTLSIWISPPKGPLDYKEGRIVVGVNRVEDGTKYIESYGICTEFSSKQCLDISQELSKFSKVKHRISDTEDLRDQVFIIEPSIGNPWSFLRKIALMDEVWDSIESGAAEKAKNEVLKDAREVGLEIESQFQKAITIENHIMVGVLAERLMKERGREIVGGACGILNSDLNFAFSHIELSSNGEVNGVSVEGGKLVVNCGECGEPINAVISAGYVCPSCGRAYKGC